MKPRWTSACFLPPCFVSNIFPHWRQVNLWSSVWLIMASTTAFRSRKAKIIPRPDFCFTVFSKNVVLLWYHLKAFLRNEWFGGFQWGTHQHRQISEQCSVNTVPKYSWSPEIFIITCLLLSPNASTYLSHKLCAVHCQFLQFVKGVYSKYNFHCMVQGELTCFGCSLV